MNKMEWIIKKAKELELDALGFCHPGPLLERYPVDFPDAKACLGVLESYRVEESPRPETGAWGRISPSAIFADYHRLVLEKTEKMGAAMEEEWGCATRSYCDRGPLPDRAVAKLCGLGQIGRNTFLINERFGTRTYIGYLLTDLDLGLKESVPEGNDVCGSCNRCVEHCPTGALTGDGGIRRERCVSALTQAKELEQPWMEKALGVQIYGCDICQAGCPHNRLSGSRNRFHPPMVSQWVDLEALLAMGNREFKDTYGRSSAGWIGRKRFQRNARIAVANQEKR
ncbi:epoxyqueuosine reductase [Anaerotalea alkaliphila]|uniref:4Fe-4S ferredoxin-type domain-containing protein n=1 Tax=Anaerotalea alkaliphila TaxID=2662126 RepID=A0A7X5KL07_9FIRM|nr:4Fe-4S double cluster binding domain-containing protein [Anaerotalea alkaliphila]NDL66331.1 hypothetical protein [Anaerotalea alkaliphila]